MIGTSLQKDSRARSSTARLPALFLGLSVLSHGLYYSQEWLIFGFVLSAYIISAFLYRSIDLDNRFTFGLTDSLLLGLLLFSLLGILYPIKLTEGLFEALHWGIFWLVYRLGVRISRDETAKRNLIQYMVWLALAIAVIGWLPWVSKVGGRLSSVFGYPNAAAVFLGVVLLLQPRRKLVMIFLAVSLLGTGSRAGVGLFLIVLIGRQLVFGVRSPGILASVRSGRNFFTRGRITSQYLTWLPGLIAGSAGLVFTLFYYKQAWRNLTTWGFSALSWQERLVYFKDGVILAWNSGGLPHAGGWWGFPTVQRIPYWTADPHSSFIHILLNQGIVGVLSVGIWGSLTLAQVWRSWKNEPILTKSRLRVGSALIFMALHSLVDADFSFGALGILFWLLFGSLQRRKEHHNMPISKWSKLFPRPSMTGVPVLSFMICLSCGAALLNPILLEREQIWNAQAAQWREQDPNKSRELWGRSLNLDQTQIEVHRELAKYFLGQGNLEAGLEAVKEVLRWQAFDLEAYEWGQSIVWEAAEVHRQSDPEKAMTLYRWVEDVPKTIEGRVVSLSSLDQKLWQGHREFLPSQHIKLLAEYARQRQLTQLLLQHKL